MKLVTVNAIYNKLFAFCFPAGPPCAEVFHHQLGRVHAGQLLAGRHRARDVLDAGEARGPDGNQFATKSRPEHVSDLQAVFRPDHGFEDRGVSINIRLLIYYYFIHNYQSTDLFTAVYAARLDSAVSRWGEGERWFLPRATYI